MPRETHKGEPIHRSTLRFKELRFKTGTEEHLQAKKAREEDQIALRDEGSDHVEIHDPHHVTSAEKRMTKHMATIKRQIVEENLRKTLTQEFPAVQLDNESFERDKQ